VNPHEDFLGYYQSLRLGARLLGGWVRMGAQDGGCAALKPCKAAVSATNAHSPRTQKNSLSLKKSRAFARRIGFNRRKYLF
jgi:hypothetical protein